MLEVQPLKGRQGSRLGQLDALDRVLVDTPETLTGFVTPLTGILSLVIITARR